MKKTWLKVLRRSGLLITLLAFNQKNYNQKFFNKMRDDYELFSRKKTRFKYVGSRAPKDRKISEKRNFILQNLSV